MQITHNVVIAGWWLLVAASSGTFGRFVAWRRFRRDLTEEYEAGRDDGYGRGYDDGYDRGWDAAEARARLKETYLPPAGRRTILLEPGPTIYPSLAALSQEPVRGPESHAKAGDTTFVRTVLLDWERRFPISQDSPNGNMAEAL